MRRIYLASPYAGEVERNVAYARDAMLDSIMRGEAPLAPHLLYPTLLDDSDPEERRIGIDAGLAWLGAARAVVAYVDFGISPGMMAEMQAAVMLGIPVEERRIR